MNITFKVILILFVILSQTFAGNDFDVWEQRLSKVLLKDVPLDQAIQKVIEIYQNQYPEDKRLSGYLIVDGEHNASTVTVDFTDVPMGEACQQITSSVGWHFTLHERTLSFFPAWSGHSAEVVHVFAVSDQIEKSLGLGKSAPLEDVLLQIQLFKIDTDLFFEKKILNLADGKYLIVKGNRKEVDTLIGLWELLSRGLTIK